MEEETVSPIMLTITGTVVSLKNSRRLVRKARTGKPFSIKSADAERYERDFVAQIPTKYRGLKLGGRNQLLKVITEVFYPSLRSDLDLAIIYDCLQLAGVVSNDRWIRAKAEYAAVDAKNPRCEIIVEEL